MGRIRDGDETVRGESEGRVNGRVIKKKQLKTGRRKKQLGHDAMPVSRDDRNQPVAKGFQRRQEGRHSNRKS